VASVRPTGREAKARLENFELVSDRLEFRENVAKMPERSYKGKQFICRLFLVTARVGGELVLKVGPNRNCPRQQNPMNRQIAVEEKKTPRTLAALSKRRRGMATPDGRGRSPFAARIHKKPAGRK